MKIACLGPCGTYSEEIARHLHPGQENEFLLYPNISEAIQAVHAGEADAGVVPIENSLEGSVTITLDMLAHGVDLSITSEIAVPIRHNLVVKGEDREMIHTIISHPQALAQCRLYIAKHYSKVACRPVDSTAAAMEMVVAGEPGIAAIGSDRAKQIYGLELVERDIQDNINNHTRFVSLARQPRRVEGTERKTSIICQIHSDYPGGLCNILEEFARWNVNLTRIESRPARTGLGKYVFFLDMEGDILDEKVSVAVNAVRIKSLWFKNLGSYRVLRYGITE